MIKVSVIVPVYNAAATIERVIAAILSQQTNHSFEIIMVDDGSTDQTPYIIKKTAQVKYIYQENAGPAKARNTGVLAAQGEFLAFTDSDCLPQSDWLENLLKGFKDERIAVVSGSYGIANPHFPLARCIHQEIIYRHRFLMPVYPKSFGSYNFCIRRKIFLEVGGFNVSYRRASGEDNDLSYKIIESGYQIFFEPKALVDHFHTHRLGKYLKEQARHGFWRVRMYADHPEMVKGDDYTFWKDMVEVPCSLLIVAMFVVSPLSGSSFKHIFLFFLTSFYIFELIAGIVMMQHFLDGIYFSFVTFFRSFSRTFGFSTGILYFIRKNIIKKI